ncbi:MAG TPA: CHASE2 domain-containing protein, partial [Candidatus Obscuribacterales bacterium]
MTENLLAARYEIMRPLGEGGFAKTYLAKDWQRQQAVCVIKHLTPANSSPQFLGTARRLFKAEAAVLRRLGTHDRIPALWDAFEAEGEFYLVQEFIDGESLHDIFKRQPVFTEAQIIALLTEVLPILAYIHQEQVIHRDIKPSNLMRRYADGKLMLIDFGAVKEITTEFHTASSEQFTVSIGTQGYSAPEQMAGRPRYSSDLYSLGMTVIRGLTGRSPTELPENPHTGELLWEAIAPSVSPGLKVFLQRLTQVSVYQRYPSAAAALDDLAHLDTLAAPPSLDLPPTMLPLSLPAPPPRHRQWLRRAIAPGLVTAIVLLIRQLGGWVPLELALYDQGVQRLTAAARDERLLLVEITEADLQTLQQPTPSDAVLARTLRTLQTYQPTVIGVDLYRDLPQGEGHAELLAALAAENVIAIRKLGVRASEAIAAPRTVTPDRVGINDFPIDADGVVRRNLLFASVNNRPDGEVLYSFGLRLALAYLAREGITPVESALNPDYLALNGTPFVR